MSLEFNRRSFLKYTAAAAVVMAGSSLLTGCGDDYTKSGTIDSKLTLIGKHTLNSVSVNGISGSTTYKIECRLTHECTDADNPLYFDNSCYELTVYKKGEKKTYADYTTESMTLTPEKVTLKKENGETDLTLTITGVKLEADDYVDLKYWPCKTPNGGQNAYTRVYCIWKMQAKTTTAGGFTLEKR